VFSSTEGCREVVFLFAYPVSPSGCTRSSCLHKHYSHEQITPVCMHTQEHVHVAGRAETYNNTCAAPRHNSVALWRGAAQRRRGALPHRAAAPHRGPILPHTTLAAHPRGTGYRSALAEPRCMQMHVNMHLHITSPRDPDPEGLRYTVGCPCHPAARRCTAQVL
jgi:hypothetical protein